MKLIIFTLAIPLALLGALAIYVRLAPSYPAQWHIDPLEATPRRGHFIVRPNGGDVESPVFSMPPTEVLQAFEVIALSNPHTTRFAGHPDEGRITFITRSRLFGFPDYTTVRAIAVDGGVALVIHARLRFGQSDLGTNETRVRGWLAAMDN